MLSIKLRYSRFIGKMNILTSDTRAILTKYNFFARFHAIDRPIVDPIAIRKAKREKTLTNINLSSSASSISSESSTSSSLSSKNKPKNWVPFSKRDNAALEKAFENGTKLVPVNEDHLFQVDIYKREISPVYWEGPVFEVRRATWFMQTDSKWLPCEENMAKQIEQGYQ